MGMVERGRIGCVYLWKTGTTTGPNHRSVDHGSLLPFEDLGAGLLCITDLGWSTSNRTWAALLILFGQCPHGLPPYTFTLFEPASPHTLSQVAG